MPNTRLQRTAMDRLPNSTVRGDSLREQGFSRGQNAFALATEYDKCDA